MDVPDAKIAEDWNITMIAAKTCRHSSQCNEVRREDSCQTLASCDGAAIAYRSAHVCHGVVQGTVPAGV
jgi:hypothetical protein